MIWLKEFEVKVKQKITLLLMRMFTFVVALSCAWLIDQRAHLALNCFEEI